MKRLLSAACAALALAGVLVAGVLSRPAPAAALSGSDFQPGNITSDSVFYNSAAMSAADVQNFLNAKFQGCASGYTCLRDYRTQTFSHAAEPGLCSAYTGQASETAAQIVARVGQACGVNPQALLVLLQKEQGLVLSTAPSTYAYTHATGQGCPDTAGCDPQYYGFFNQVFYAARQFKLYRLYPTNYGYVAGRNNYIQYNPNANCGGAMVYIQNQATAGLYDYTPYQPNAAALANLNGSGDSCSAYGNRNFWVFFNTWFSTPSAPYDPGGLLATKPDGTLWYYRDDPSASAPFPSGVQIGLGGWQQYDRMVVGDVDGDGLGDVIATRADGSLWLMRNDGSSLPYQNALSIGASGWGAFDRILTADVTGDGLTDLVTTKPDGTLWLYVNNGNPAHPYSTRVNIGASGWSAYTSMTLADVDGDGRADLIARKADGSLWLYRNNGNDAHPYGDRILIGGWGWNIFDTLIGTDVDSDGRADLVARKPDGSLWLYRNGGDPDHPFTSSTRIGASGWSSFDKIAATAVPVPRRATSGDLVARKSDGSLWRFPNNVPPAPYPAPSSLLSGGLQGYDRVLAGDVDGDKRADLVATSATGQLYLLRNTGTGFAAALQIGASGWRSFDALLLGDVTGDGKADLVGRAADGSLWLYPNNGDPTHPFSASYRIGASGWHGFDALAVGDLTGDGKADLVARAPDGSLWLYANSGSPTYPFSARQRLAATGWSGYDTIVAADVDGDGRADLVARGTDGSLWLSRDSGSATAPLLPAVQIAASGWNAYSSVFAGDLTGDGKADLFATTPSGALYLSANDGMGPFQPGTQIGASGWNGFDKLAIGDVNGDGYPDIVGSKPDGTLWLYLNSGVATRPYTTGTLIGGSGWSNFDRMYLGDVNGDGWADLLLTTTSGQLWLYPNLHSATRPFAGGTPIESAGWQNYDAIAVGDVNGDGLADIVARRSTDGTLWVRYDTHQPNSLFGPPVAVTGVTGTDWTAYDRFALGDVDHGNGADLVAVDKAGVLTVFPNTGSMTAPFGAGAPDASGTAYSAFGPLLVH